LQLLLGFKLRFGHHCSYLFQEMGALGLLGWRRKRKWRLVNDGNANG
jgi:hypothetical protein